MAAGLGLVGNDEALPLRNLLGVQQLSRTDWFGVGYASPEGPRKNPSCIALLVAASWSSESHQTLFAGSRLAPNFFATSF